MKRFVLGIDGGGTHTRAVIADETGYICGFGKAGPSNYNDIGLEAARANILSAVYAARDAANLDGALCAAAFLGMAGVVSDRDRQLIGTIAAELPLEKDAFVGIDHDCRIALAGGLSGRPGIVVIIGTGSSVYGRNLQGEDWRSGGWGYLISDEGSGYWFGLQALRLTVMHFDGRIEAKDLAWRVMQELQIVEPQDIMNRIYVPPLGKAEIAALGPLVIEFSQRGNPHAQQLIQQGVEDLAKCVFAVAHRLNLNKPEIVVTGGLASTGEPILGPLRASIRSHLRDCQFTPAELPPVIGAIVLALSHIIPEKLERAVALLHASVGERRLV
ncbi:MAG: BadF/BadG/BcrA/BcrD ATPase family protein [Aggregatilineales bacterium]